MVYTRWETYGWQLGKITGVVTEATPRLFKKSNFRLVWANNRQTSRRGQAYKSHRKKTMPTVQMRNSWVIS
jgi:hypothetical protein